MAESFDLSQEALKNTLSDLLTGEFSPGILKNIISGYLKPRHFCIKHFF